MRSKAPDGFEQKRPGFSWTDTTKDGVTSEAKPDWLVKLEEVREATEDPLVDGIAHIGTYTMDNVKALDKRLDAAESRDDEIKRGLNKTKDDLRTEMETGFKAIAEKVDSVSKRQLMTGIAGVGESGQIFSADDRLGAALGEQKSLLLGQADIAISANVAKKERLIERGLSRGYSTRLENPYFAAAACKWVHCATLLSLPKISAGKAGPIREEMEKIERAFIDLMPGVATKAAYAEGADATGGFLVPAPVAAELLRIALDSGVVASRARRIPMSGDTLDVPEEGTNVSVAWGAEAAAIASGEGTFGQVNLVANRLGARATASIEAIQDSVIGLLPYIQFAMAEAMGKELDLQILEGSGSPFTGVIGDADVNDVDAGGDAANGATVRHDDLTAAVFAADESSVEEGAAWFMHRKHYGSIVNLKDTDGSPIFQAPGMLPDSPRGALLGFPIHTTSSIDATVTKGTATSNTGTIYFGDPRRALLGVRQDLRFDATETGPGWANYQADMRMVGRFAIAIATGAAWSKINGAVVIGG